jgi:predicted ATPase/DNA-binding winged helix-turn-helix (wHTH) protein
VPEKAEVSIYRFGRWEVDLGGRQLRADGAVAPLGSRAFDIFEQLLLSAGELLTKEDLMRRVWAGVVVNENALHVHVAAIRKALGADRDVIDTVSGRGYRLLGAWTAVAAAAAASPAPPDAPRPLRGNLPIAAATLIGRAAAAGQVGRLVSANRVVTLSGPGGIGKTRLALEAGQALSTRFPDGVWFVDLCPVADPALVPSAAAAAIGLDFGVGDVSSERIATATAGRALLLVLDNCEHVIDAAARLAEAIVRASPAPYVLATSREPLGIDGEQVYRVQALEVPSDEAGAPSAVMEHPAVQLFVTRLQDSRPDFAPAPETLGDIATICRRLDGIPLAIELAAARAAMLGVTETAANLDHRFRMLTQGRRTAPPHQRTLQALLDWSYDLLSEYERRILRRVAIFTGGFTLAAAAVIAADTESDARGIADGIAGLTMKSLLIVDPAEATPRYTMLETIRAHALERLARDPDKPTIAHRHAAYFRDLFAAAQSAWHIMPSGDWLRLYRPEIANVRAALDWAFSEQGDAGLAIALADNAIPMMFDIALVAECRHLATRALMAVAAGTPIEPRAEMRLRTVVQASWVYTEGPSPASLAGWRTVLDMARRLGDGAYETRALWGLWNDSTYGGAHDDGLSFAEHFTAVSAAQSDAAKQIMARRLLGISRHYRGELSAARADLAFVIASFDRDKHRWQTIGSRLEQATASRATLARIMWLQGEVDQAAQMATHAARDAAADDHTQSILYITVEAEIPLAFLTGDRAAAARLTETLLARAARSGFMIWHAYAECCRQVLRVADGDRRSGLADLHIAVEKLRDSGFHAHLTMFLGLLADVESRAGHPQAALALIDGALQRADGGHEGWCKAELLRIKAQVVAHDPSAASSEAEGLFRQAIGLARAQGALAWELRSAMGLARLLQKQGAPAAACSELAPVLARFREGFGTADLIAAHALLGSLGHTPPGRPDH